MAAAARGRYSRSAFLGILAAAVAGLGGIYTDVPWFRELGHDRVLWTTLEFKLLAHGLPGFGTAAFVLVDLAAAAGWLDALTLCLAYLLTAIVVALLPADPAVAFGPLVLLTAALVIDARHAGYSGVGQEPKSAV